MSSKNGLGDRILRTASNAAIEKWRATTPPQMTRPLFADDEGRAKGEAPAAAPATPPTDAKHAENRVHRAPHTVAGGSQRSRRSSSMSFDSATAKEGLRSRKNRASRAASSYAENTRNSISELKNKARKSQGDITKSIRKGSKTISIRPEDEQSGSKVQSPVALVGELFIFCSFLALYTTSSVMGRDMEELYYFKERLHSEVCSGLVQNQLDQSPGVRSMADFHRWMSNNFYNRMFSKNEPSDYRSAFVLGHTFVVGTPRISQLRARNYSCITGSSSSVLSIDQSTSAANQYLLQNNTDFECFQTWAHEHDDNETYGRACDFDSNKGTCARVCSGSELITLANPLPDSQPRWREQPRCVQDPAERGSAVGSKWFDPLMSKCPVNGTAKLCTHWVNCDFEGNCPPKQTLDCELTPFSNWSNCASTPGNDLHGTQSRSRTVVKESRCVFSEGGSRVECGLSCAEHVLLETRSCAMPCANHTEAYEDWGSWSTCNNRHCAGNGTRTRLRSLKPGNNKTLCLSLNETESCNNVVLRKTCPAGQTSCADSDSICTQTFEIDTLGRRCLNYSSLLPDKRTQFGDPLRSSASDRDLWCAQRWPDDDEADCGWKRNCSISAYENCVQVCKGTMQPKRQYGFVPHDTTGATADTSFSPLGNVYSTVPRFFVQLDVRDEEEFIKTLNTLYDAKWLDLKTRIIYLDINFFNPSTHALAAMRIAVELPITGGAYADCSSLIVKFERLHNPWNLDESNAMVYIRFILELATAGIFATYVLNEVKLLFFGQISLGKGKNWWRLLCTACYDAQVEFERRERKAAAQKKRDAKGEDVSAKKSGKAGKDSPEEESSSNEDDEVDGDKLGDDKSVRKARRLNRNSLSTDGFHSVAKFASVRFYDCVLLQMRRLSNISFWHFVRIVNLCLFFAYTAYRWWAIQAVPQGIDPDEATYSSSIREAADLLVTSNTINACNIFLLFTELFRILKYFQGKHLWISILLVLIVLSGEALAHMLAFGAQQAEFRTFFRAFKSLMSGLFGSYEYTETQGGSALIGTTMWVVYFFQTICLAGFLIYSVYLWVKNFLTEGGKDYNTSMGDEVVGVVDKVTSSLFDRAKQTFVDPVAHTLAAAAGDRADRRHGWRSRSRGSQRDMGSPGSSPMPSPAGPQPSNSSASGSPPEALQPSPRRTSLFGGVRRRFSNFLGRGNRRSTVTDTPTMTGTPMAPTLEIQVVQEGDDEGSSRMHSFLGNPIPPSPLALTDAGRKQAKPEQANELASVLNMSQLEAALTSHVVNGDKTSSSLPDGPQQPRLSGLGQLLNKATKTAEAVPSAIDSTAAAVSAMASAVSTAGLTPGRNGRAYSSMGINSVEGREYARTHSSSGGSVDDLTNDWSPQDLAEGMERTLAPGTNDVMRRRAAHSVATLREMWGNASPRTITRQGRAELQGLVTTFVTHQVQSGGFASLERGRQSLRQLNRHQQSERDLENVDSGRDGNAAFVRTRRRSSSDGGHVGGGAAPTELELWEMQHAADLRARQPSAAGDLAGAETALQGEVRPANSTVSHVQGASSQQEWLEMQSARLASKQASAADKTDTTVAPAPENVPAPVPENVPAPAPVPGSMSSSSILDSHSATPPPPPAEPMSPMTAAVTAAQESDKSMSGSASKEDVGAAQSQVLESADVPELGEPPFDGPRLSRRHSEDSYIRAERYTDTMHALHEWASEVVTLPVDAEKQAVPTAEAGAEVEATAQGTFANTESSEAANAVQEAPKCAGVQAVLQVASAALGAMASVLKSVEPSAAAYTEAPSANESDATATTASAATDKATVAATETAPALVPPCVLTAAERADPATVLHFCVELTRGNIHTDGTRGFNLGGAAGPNTEAVLPMAVVHAAHEFARQLTTAVTHAAATSTADETGTEHSDVDLREEHDALETHVGSQLGASDSKVHSTDASRMVVDVAGDGVAPMDSNAVVELMIVELVSGERVAPILSEWWWGLDEHHSDLFCDALRTALRPPASHIEALATAEAAIARTEANISPVHLLFGRILTCYELLLSQTLQSPSASSSSSLHTQVSNGPGTEHDSVPLSALLPANEQKTEAEAEQEEDADQEQEQDADQEQEQEDKKSVAASTSQRVAEVEDSKEREQEQEQEDKKSATVSTSQRVADVEDSKEREQEQEQAQARMKAQAHAKHATPTVSDEEKQTDVEQEARAEEEEKSKADNKAQNAKVSTIMGGAEARRTIEVAAEETDEADTNAEDEMKKEEGQGGNEEEHEKEETQNALEIDTDDDDAGSDVVRTERFFSAADAPPENNS